MAGGLKPSGGSGLGLRPSGGSSGGLKPSAGIGGGPASIAMRQGDTHSGGFFGWLGSKLSLAGHDLAQMPGGLYQAAKYLNPITPGIHEFTRGHAAVMRENQQSINFLKRAAKSTEQTVEHPLRDPFAFGLTVAPGFGMAGRFGEAGLAAKTADVAAGESRLGEAAKALVRTHGNEPPRVLKSGGRVIQKDGVTMRIGGNRDVNLIPSRNAGKRFFLERPYDAAVQKAMNEQAKAEGASRIVSRIAEHGKKRVAGALAEEQRAVQRMNAIPADKLERSALKLSKLPFRMGGKIHSAASELTSTQTPPEVAISYHEGQAAKLAQLAREGVDSAGNALTKEDRQAALEAAKNNKGAADLYRKVQQNDLVHTDMTRPNGQKVFINPDKKHLAAADAALEHAGNVNEAAIREHNLMSQAGQRAALDNPGLVRHGAEYVPPTPGRLGVESPTLVEARAQLTKAEKLFAKVKLRAMGKIENSRSVMHEFASRQMTDAEAQARLAALDKQYNDLVDKTISHVSPHTRETGPTGRAYSPEQMRRNFESGKSGKKLETVKQEEQRLADEKLRQIAKEQAGTPMGEHLAKLITERDHLQTVLQSRADAPIFGHEAPALPHIAGNGHNYGMPWMRDPEVQRFAGHVSILKDRVQKLEALHHNRIEPTGFVGAEGALPGRTHISYRSVEKNGEPGVLSAAQRSRVGSPASPISKTQHFTGANIAEGKVPKNVFTSVAKHTRQIAKFKNTLSLRRAVWEADMSPLKRSANDILMRAPGREAKPLTEAMQQAIGEVHSALHDHVSMQELHAGTQEGLTALHQWLNQHILDKAEASKGDAIGTRAQDGYGWVNRHLVEQLQKDAAPSATGVRTLPGKLMDNTNAAVTALTVYFKVGHAFTRVFTNAATNIMQGSLRPDQYGKNLALWRSLSKAEQDRLVAAAGQQGFAALPVEAGTEGPISRGIAGAARGGARVWAQYADRYFRANSLMYELRKIGYSTPEDITKALDAIQRSGHGMPASEWSKVSAAFRRADREAISYDRLNENEKKYLARAVWFYPWVKGSTAFTMRSIIEHPWKMAGLGQAGVMGRNEQLKQLGPVPSYEQGLIDVGGNQAMTPETVDMNTFSPVGTAGQLLNVPTVHGAIAQQLNPVMGSLVGLATGTNSFGEPSNNPYADALQNLISSTPESQIYDAIKRQESGKSQAKRMFPDSSWQAGLRRYFLGPGIASRPVNKAALAKAFVREHSKRYTVYSSK